MYYSAIVIFLCSFLAGYCGGQIQDSSCTLMFYNVENLFDFKNDSTTADDDFTPAGSMHWTTGKYYEKLNKICKVIIAAGGWSPPVIIGLCEIENRDVLNDLIFKTPLSKFSYKIVHKDSPDERGIDVALLYEPKAVRILSSSFIEVSRKDLRTRDILYVKSVISKDTCHVFVNHWPSRSSGQVETEGNRILAAIVLRNKVDSILNMDPLAKIILMGDFNDDPEDVSIIQGLMTLAPSDSYLPDKLYNLSVEPTSGPVKGTLKYRGSWNMFDQIIVSGSLLSDTQELRTGKNYYRILQNGFLVETDETYSGVKPFRTYLGFRYHGGFSDHLPVVLEMRY